MRQKFLILAVLVAAAPALAEDHPLLRPKRDVAVEYRSSGSPQGPASGLDNTVTIRFATRSNRIRIDGSAGHQYLVLEPDAGRMTMVMTDRQTYMEGPADPGMMAMFQGTNATFRKTGTATIASTACTTYDATINNRDGQVCLTDDGVLLRAHSTDPARNRELEAVKVTYAEQPASLFEIPAGFQKMDVPGARRGITMEPPGGVPPGGYPGSRTGQ
jgi:hypothetical protein